MFNRRYFIHSYFNPRYFEQQPENLADAGTAEVTLLPSGDGRVTGAAVIVPAGVGKRRQFDDIYAPVPAYDRGMATLTLIASGAGRVVGISRESARRSRLRAEEETYILLFDEEWSEAA